MLLDMARSKRTGQQTESVQKFISLRQGKKRLPGMKKKASKP